MRPQIAHVQKAVRSADDELAGHLKEAEAHLIEAVKLFAQSKKPIRDVGYYKRLVTAQESITSLYRLELIRIRGPLKPPRRRRR